VLAHSIVHVIVSDTLVFDMYHNFRNIWDLGSLHNTNEKANLLLLIYS